MKIFILDNLIVNIDNEIDSKALIEQNAWEMPQEQIKKVFGDYAHLASNDNCTFAKNGDGYDVIFILDENKLLEDSKNAKLNELESLKSSAENADILYKDKLYQADSKAKELLTQSLVIFSSVGAVPDNFAWKSSDNSLNTFSLDDLKNLSLLIAQRTQEITAKYWAYKEQIRNATTKEELDLINMEF
ncbi:DUF4376 domain-containing protein [Campylobacter sp. RM12640]|uniref:DUF4376 domain-containing protein n=1 Tax=unclassified Campylobacter TaxID=2593542 RepID=UPI0030148A6B|nr:DUF4376 domain-containing protein [Campylobacter sp. RM12640]MBZ7990051.1 DUF4376 domain-containing protein [Campylobacter sp. RM12635]